MSYVELANKILLLKIYETNFDAPFLSDEKAIEKSEEFYKKVLNKDGSELNDKINYSFSSDLQEYNGKCMVTSFGPNGKRKVTIILPEEKSARKIITLSHEKAHAYHMLKDFETSELVPSFLDILNGIKLDEEYPGIKIDNLNYKTRQAKRAAEVYLRYYKRKNVQAQIDYMIDFFNSIYLIEKYISGGNDEIITKINAQLNENQISRKIYSDDFEAKKAIEFIIKK